MANSGRLEIEIGADVSGLENGISQAERQLRTLESRRDARVRIGADTSELDRRISGVNTRLNELRTSATTAQTAMRGMTGQVGNGSNALMQFSRIAQDAPYGIIGIGNNLTATAEAFGHLRNQTGSAGGALRAMASSLMGTGGILLGVSLLTTGFTLLAQSGLSVGDIIDKITGNFDEAKESLHKLGLEAAKTAGTEISELKSLVSVAQNDTKSREERLIAVQKLQSEFPAYFGNLSTERILNGNVTESIKNVSDALKARARASAIYGKVGELSAKRLELEEKREQAITKLKEAQKASDADSSVYAAGLRFNLKGAVDDYKDIVEEIKNVDKAITKLQSKANVDTTASVLLEQKAPPKTKETQSFNTPQVTGVTSTIVPAPLFDLNGIAVFNGQVDGFGNKLKSLPNVITTSMGQIHLAADMGLLELNALLYNFSEEVNELASTSIAGAFQSLGDNIGNALANGTNVLSAVGNGLLQSLGGFLGELGTRLITYGLLLAGFGKAELAFKVGDPVTKIGAGIAMVALGIAAKGAGAVVSSAGSKGLSGGKGASTSSGSTANNSSRVSGGFSGGSSFGGGTVVFEIAGTSLIGVLNNTQARNLRIGGTN